MNFLPKPNKANDPYKNAVDHIDTPTCGWVEAVTPHATNNLTRASKYIYVGGTGDVTVETIYGNVVTFKAVPVGTILPVRAIRVNAVNTTATLMLAMS